MKDDHELCLRAGANDYLAKPIDLDRLGELLMQAALRNLIEYQAELLYGRGQTVTRLVLYALVGTLKAALMVLLLSHDRAGGQWLVWLNGVFAALYAVSFAVTYRALAQPAIRV